MATTMLASRCLRAASAARPNGVRALSSFWANVPQGPPDPIIGLNERFGKDEDPRKVNVGVGAYRDDGGKPFVLSSVNKAEKALVEEGLNMEYAPITGVPGYMDVALKFAYGEDSDVYPRLAATQALSGTGALRIGFAYLNKFMGEGCPVYMPGPTWANHIPTAEHAGCEVRTYKYYESEPTPRLDFSGMLDDVNAAPDGSVFMLHACAHNPTGIDPTEEQWCELSELMKKKGHLPFFDSAYQGFASGDAEKDAFAVRRFVADGHQIALCQSFAKNFGLYGHRIGAFSFVCQDEEEAARVLSQIKILIRPMYSSPPITGARIVEKVLKDPALKTEWYAECKSMADRIIGVRAQMVDELKAAGSTKDWSHVTSQIGMFCFSGLNPDQVKTMVDDHHVYMTGNGRISMAGVTSGNVKYIAQAMHDVTK